MLLVDANVLIYAFRRDEPRHDLHHRWLSRALSSEVVCGLSEIGLTAVLRILTHPRLAVKAPALEEVLAYIDWLREHPRTIVLAPGARHWSIVKDLCRRANARGNLVMDAYVAALAIEHSAELISTDGDFGRFPDLRWRRPLD